jgi:DNA helicase-2/ATP-dependent DNA helicase PcrA
MFVLEIDPEKISKVDTTLFEEKSGDTLKAYFVNKVNKTDKEEINSYLKGLLTDYTLSATHLNNYLKCPRLFFYQNFIRVPVLKNKHMSLGTAVHTAVEALYRSAVDSPEILSKQQFLKKFERELGRELLNDQDYADSLENGLDFLSKYYDQYSENLPSDILIELDFRSHAVCLDEISLTGKLDLVHITDKIGRIVEVVDFKTGSAENKGSYLKRGGDYHRQIVFYQLLCNLSKRFGYRMSKGIIDFIQPRNDGTFLKDVIRVSDEDLEIVKEEIRLVWNSIHRLEFDCLDPNGFCEHCEKVLIENLSEE